MPAAPYPAPEVADGIVNRAMYRYQLPVSDSPRELQMSAGAEIRSVAGSLYMVEFWAEDFGPEARVSRRFQVFGTGHPLPVNADWRGTCQRTDGGLVWHLYELLAGTAPGVHA